MHSQEGIVRGDRAARQARLEHLLITQTIISATFAQQEARQPINIWINLNLGKSVLFPHLVARPNQLCSSARCGQGLECAVINAISFSGWHSITIHSMISLSYAPLPPPRLLGGVEQSGDFAN